jgi:hypothetical protein
MVADFVATLFRWPDGIVVGNLIASALWAIPAVIHLDRLAKKHHRIHMATLERHHREVMANDHGSSNDSSHVGD